MHVRTQHKYFPASDMSESEITAALADGAITPWRVDAEGRQWFARCRPNKIKAVPPKFGLIRGVQNWLAGKGKIGD